MYQHGTLLMEWCLDCHRDPEPQPAAGRRHLRHGLELAGPGTDAEAEGRVLADKDHYDIQPTRKLIDCSTCHR